MGWRHQRHSSSAASLQKPAYAELALSFPTFPTNCFCPPASHSFLVWQARLHPPPGSEEPISSIWGWRTPSDISKCQFHTDLTSSPDRGGWCELQCKFWGSFIAHLWPKWGKSQPSRAERTICARTQVQYFHKAVAILVKWVKHPWVSWQEQVMTPLNEGLPRWVGSRLQLLWFLASTARGASLRKANESGTNTQERG